MTGFVVQGHDLENKTKGSQPKVGYIYIYTHLIIISRYGKKSELFESNKFTSIN